MDSLQVSRGKLPHFSQAGLVQMITFRVVRQLRSSTPLSVFRIADEVVEAILWRDTRQYQLHAFCVMPDHVHLLFQQIPQHPLASILRGLKSRTALRANGILGREGQFWERESWDTYMRNGTHAQTCARYIENNPVRAGLVDAPEHYPWSSAHYRSEFGL